MTVKDLQELLASFPPEMPVLVDGYEGGYDDIADEPTVIEVVVKPNAPDYWGRYDYPHAYPETHESGQKVLLLSRLLRG